MTIFIEFIPFIPVSFIAHITRTRTFTIFHNSSTKDDDGQLIGICPTTDTDISPSNPKTSNPSEVSMIKNVSSLKDHFLKEQIYLHIYIFNAKYLLILRSFSKLSLPNFTEA